MNLPNFLSLLRLLMVPLFPIIYTSPGLAGAQYYAAAIYFAAAGTDVIDGWLARRSGQITKMGRILDPLADKAMAFTVLLTITIAGAVHWWAVAVLFAKDLVMAVGALTMFKKRNDVFAAKIIGKASTVVFFLVCMVLMLFNFNPAVKNLLLAVTVGMNLASLAYYLFMYFTQVAGKKTEDRGQKTEDA